MSEASIGYGSSLEYSANGADFSRVGKVVNIPGPNYQVPGAKATSQDSEDATHEYIPKLGDPQQFSISLIQDSNVLQTLWGLYRQVVSWRITTPETNSVTWMGKGFISGYKPDQPLDDVMTVDVDLQPSGKWALS